MKVIEIIDDFCQGAGVNTFVFDLCYALHQANCEVMLIGVMDKGFDNNSEVDFLKKVGVKVVCLEAKSKKYALINHVAQLRKIIIEFAQDENIVCNLHLKLSELMGCLATIGLNNVKCVETYHNTYHHYHLQCFVQRPFIKKYICVSEEARKEMLRRFHTRRHDTIAIPNGISRDKIRSLVTETGSVLSDREPLQLLSVGRLSYEKNFLTVVEALKDVCNEHIIYTLAGGGNQYDQIVEVAKDNPHIHILGRQTRAQCLQLLSGADIVIMPSLWEGRSILQLEAAAFDKPMILSDVPGLREPFNEKPLEAEELFRVCDFGYLVEVSEIKAYQEAVKHYYNNRNMLKGKIEKKVHSISVKNDIKSVANRYIECFRACF